MRERDDRLFESESESESESKAELRPDDEDDPDDDDSDDEDTDDLQPRKRAEARVDQCVASPAELRPQQRGTHLGFFLPDPSALPLPLSFSAARSASRCLRISSAMPFLLVDTVYASVGSPTHATWPAAPRPKLIGELDARPVPRRRAGLEKLRARWARLVHGRRGALIGHVAGAQAFLRG